MSDKRSERLRSMIAATVSDAAEDAAPVTVTGSAMPAARPEPKVAAASPVSRLAASESNHLPGSQIIDISKTPIEGVPVSASSADEPSVEMRVTTAENVGTSRRGSARHHVLRAPQKPIKAPKWEKANVTLEPRDLAILERSDAQARAYGFRIRKGGNPSLFVRAGLRLLDELEEHDPEAWIKHIAATTSIVADVPE